MQDKIINTVRVAALICVAIVVSGCVKTFHTAANFKPPTAETRVLLMPADVELSLLTASGILEPNAEWTDQGKKNVNATILSHLAAKNIKVATYGEDTKNTELREEDVQLV